MSVGKEYNLTLKFIDAFEKGKNAFIISRIYGYEVTAKGKSLAFYIDRNIFIRGLGKAGFKGTGESKPIPEAPKRNPDIVLNEKTFPNQAFFYRLNGDSNPLHIDPKIAALAGFEKPIIHGN